MAGNPNNVIHDSLKDVRVAYSLSELSEATGIKPLTLLEIARFCELGETISSRHRVFTLVDIDRLCEIASYNNAQKIKKYISKFSNVYVS